MLITILGYGKYDGKRYTVAARLTAAYAITPAGLRFSRKTGKQCAVRRGGAGFRLAPESLTAVAAGRLA